MTKKKTTWEEMLLQFNIKEHDIISIFPKDIDLKKEFNIGYYSNNQEEFVAWTSDKVIVTHDSYGFKYLIVIPRNPADKINFDKIKSD